MEQRLERIESELRAVSDQVSELKNGAIPTIKAEVIYIKDRQTRQEGYIVDLFNENKQQSIETLKAIAEVKEGIHKSLNDLKKSLSDKEEKNNNFKIDVVSKISVLMFFMSVAMGAAYYLFKG